MKDIYFYSDYLTQNYLVDSDFYSYMNYNEVFLPHLKTKLDSFSFTGKYVYSNYIYWLAKNKNYNVFHTTDVSKIPANSILIFHFDFYNSFELRKDLINIQILSDKALVPFADYYITNNLSFFNSQKFKNVLYLPEPIPARNLDFIPSDVTVPSNFRFLGIRNNFPEFLTDDLCKELRKDNINIVKDFAKNYLEPDDHVFFFLRNNKGAALKHSNRIFLSYITEIPFIGNINEDDLRFVKNSKDILPVNNKDELLKAFYFLKNEDNFRQIKNNLRVDKSFYKDYFFKELNKLISFLETL